MVLFCAARAAAGAGTMVGCRWRGAGCSSCIWGCINCMIGSWAGSWLLGCIVGCTANPVVGCISGCVDHAAGDGIVGTGGGSQVEDMEIGFHLNAEALVFCCSGLGSTAARAFEQGRLSFASSWPRLRLTWLHGDSSTWRKVLGSVHVALLAEDWIAGASALHRTASVCASATSARSRSIADRMHECSEGPFPSLIRAAVRPLCSVSLAGRSKIDACAGGRTNHADRVRHLLVLKFLRVSWTLFVRLQYQYCRGFKHRYSDDWAGSWRGSVAYRIV